MSWSYTSESGVDLDAVRLLIGDTNEDDPQLSNVEIAIFTASSASPQAAAAKAAQALAFKYARQVDKWVGDLKILASQRSKQYQRLYEELLNLGAASLVSSVPTAGGVYQSEKDAYAANPALAPSAFQRGMNDNDEL